jgi:PAS domain S-box-containing protein
VEPWTADGLLSSVVPSSPLATVILDVGRTIRVVNPAAERLTGRPATELVGRPAAELFPVGEADHALALLEAAVRGDTGHVEMTWRTGDGGAVPVGVSWAPVHHDGEVVGLVGVGRDIADRKTLERDLRSMADSFRALAEGSSDLGMYRFSFDPVLRVDYVNPHLEATYGVTLAELREDPSPLWERIDDHARTQLDRTRRGEAIAWPVDAIWRHPDGRRLEVQFHEVPLRGESGQLGAVLGVVRDVTGQRREKRALASALDLERAAAERLRRVDQLRQVFLQAVSHELRTPLTSILGFGATLRHRGAQLDGALVTELADRLHGQATHMQVLLDDLLDVDRLSRGVLTLERTATDIGDLVRRVCRDHADDHHLDIEVTACTAEVDAAKVERIVDNLLTNAWRHAGADAAVRVRVLPGDPVRIEVDDDGPGVPAELRPSVFEPFAQGRNATGAPSPGTGIGLTLVSAFAELHGGRASVHDSDLGGARFVVELPATSERQP